MAGVMVGTYYGIAQYQMGFILGLKAFSAAVLGGIGNLAGAMLGGGVLLGSIEALGARLCRRSHQPVPDRVVVRCDREALRRRSEPHAVRLLTTRTSSRSWCWIAVLIFRPSGLLGERVSDRA